MNACFIPHDFHVKTVLPLNKKSSFKIHLVSEYNFSFPKCQSQPFSSFIHTLKV